MGRDASASRHPLQAFSLRRLRDERVAVFLYLINGARLQGTIVAFDRHVVILSVGPARHLVYKSVISTIVPSRPVVPGRQLL
jgi:host factor-I protein